jgi:RNA polymerase sigma factor (sigma-70 family)
MAAKLGVRAAPTFHCHRCLTRGWTAARRGAPVSTELVDRARAGDGEAFRQVAEPHRRELQLHCYRMLGSLQDAEDALQDTLLAAWRGLAAFEGRSSLRTWLYQVATSRCLNILRANRRRPVAPTYRIRTGMVRGPRTWPADHVTAVGSTSSKSGYRFIHSSRATRSSMRARLEPMQRWMPRPKAA